MTEWYGAWGSVPGATVRHMVRWDGEAWRTRCGRLEGRALDRVTDSPDVRPCAMCVRRLRWTADWWAEKHEEALIALEAAR